MEDWESYFYPGTDVLRNKLGIQSDDELEIAEIEHVEQRIREGCPKGNFDLEHLKAIHRHLFQDMYEWAGELRTVHMVKGESSFMPPDRIEMGMADVHRRLVDANFLKDTDIWTFAAKAAEIIGDINHAHPFREGNGRTQLQFLKLLGEQAGHDIDLTKFERVPWTQASIEANVGSYGAMNDHIRQAIAPVQALTKEPERGDTQQESILPAEELARLRQALEARQEKERRDLLERHETERTQLAPNNKDGTLEKLAKRQTEEIAEQKKRQGEELPRYIREREEAQRLREALEDQQRRARELGHEQESHRRSR